jgi:hypothetical protein
VNRAAAALCAIVGLLATGALADPPVDAGTKCRVATGYFDRHDDPHAREAMLLIKRLLATYDQASAARGEEAVFAKLNDDRAQDILVAVIEYCPTTLSTR